MDEDRKALLAAVAAAAAARSTGENSVEQYESLLVYVKRHSSSLKRDTSRCCCTPQEFREDPICGPCLDFASTCEQARLCLEARRLAERSDDLNLEEVFQTMPKKEHTRVWTRLLETVTPIVEEERFLYQEEEEEESGDEQQEEKEEEAPAVTKGTAKHSVGESGDGSTTPERPSTPEGHGAGPVPCRPQRRGAALAKVAAVAEDGGTGGGGSGGGDKNKAKKKGGQASASLATEVLHATATLAQEFLSDKDRVAPRALVDTAVCLHDILLSLQGLQGEALQGVIAKVCETWWTQDRPGAEHLVVHLLPVMLVRSLGPSAKEADVKRMYGIRKALLLLDFEDESSDSLRALLLRTFIAPVYLKCSEGKRLLASLFGLHPSLVAEIHAVMKAQMPGARKAVLAAYGEIYFRVWRGAGGPYLEKVEMLCLQDLMHACVHASTPKMHQNILLVLDGLHSQKKVKGVDADLLRLYGPVMWRSLRVANPSVRAQACQVLVDAFPLQDPSAGAAAFDTTLRQQFDALTNLLEDTHPRVRAVAAKGACRVLSVFWEMVPTDTTRALLTRVVGRLASDGAAPLVRLAAVEGLTLLLECPASHSVLKSMLPGVQNLIHDTNKKVRTAFVKLLLVVKGVKSIKYYQVVTVDHILARLSEDHARCPACASALSKLILNSYFPTGPGVTGASQVSRCLTLLSQDPGAAEAFFSRLHQNAGVPSAAKMIAMLVRCVVVAARSPAAADAGPAGGDGLEAEKGQAEKGARKGKRKGVHKQEQGQQQEQEGTGERGGKGGGLAIKASDSKSMAGILNLTASIWESILPALEKNVNEPSLELIQQTVTGEALSILHRRFSGHPDSRAAFMRVAGLAGGDLAPGMLEDVVLEMLTLPADAPQPAYGPTVDLLCSWGQHEHLLGAVVDSLRKAFSPLGVGAGEVGSSAAADDATDSTTNSGPRGKRRRPASRKRGDDDVEGGDEHGPSLPAPLALNMLGHLLTGGKGQPSTEAARDAIMANDAAVGSLEAVLLLARAATTARLSSSSPSVITASPAAAPSSAVTTKLEAEGQEARRRRCPDAILVRAMEALGRVYMHREAAMAGDCNSLARRGGGGAASGKELQQQRREEEEGEEEEEEMASMLQPMPFSLKMRELMVWATSTVLPVLVGGVGGGVGGDVVEDRGGTPVKPAGASLVVGSPSPMPPPRSRARASSSGSDRDGVNAAAAAAVAAEAEVAAGAAAEAASALAGGVFGVVLLLASEWVEVGSGLAEISMRADTWGNRFLALLNQEEDGEQDRRASSSSSINALLPQLCRLSLHLSARESQGARPPASIWEVLLKCADRRVSNSQEGAEVDEDGDEEERGSTYVQKYVSALVTLEGRKDGMSPLVQSLLEFMYSQAFTSDEEDEAEDEGETSDKGPSIDTLMRLEVRAIQDADSDKTPESLLLQLSRPAAAVLWVVVRSAPASRMAGELVLSHLAAFGSGDASGTGADWSLFCAHVLGALIEHAPAKARLELAADAHAELKAITTTAAAAAAAGPTSLLSSSYVSARNNSNSVVMSPAVAAAAVAMIASPGASSENGGDASGVRVEEGVSTRKAAAFAVGAIYGRLEAARRAAATAGEIGRRAGPVVGVGAQGPSATVAISA